MRRAWMLLAFGLATACQGFDSGQPAMEVMWPARGDTVRDTTFLAVVRLRDDLLGNVTLGFTAQIDAGTAVTGVRQSNVVVFPFTVTGNRDHVFRISTSNGQEIVRTLPVWLDFPPRVHGISVDSAARGAATVIELSGDRFVADLTQNQVLLNGVPLTVTASTESTIRFTVPDAPDVHSGVLVVTSNGVQSPDFLTFTVIGDAVVPRVGALWPTRGRAFIPVRVMASGVSTVPTLTPVFNGIPGLTLFDRQEYVRSIGTVVAGWTLVPASAPFGTGTLRIQLPSGLSEGHPFTKQ